MAWEISDDEARASFEVVEVSSLPDIDRATILVEPSIERPCGCRYCDADWPTIAATSVEILEAGIDPLDSDAVEKRAAALGVVDDVDLDWLLSLFSPTDGIIHLQQCGQFTNGRHRTHALRLAGVERVVVYTGKGEQGH